LRSGRLVVAENSGAAVFLAMQGRKTGNRFERNGFVLASQNEKMGFYFVNPVEIPIFVSVFGFSRMQKDP